MHYSKTISFNTPQLELLMLNKFLIPAALVATVVIAGIFAFMPVEKASTVHGTLATSTGQTTTNSNVDDEMDAQDRSLFFKFNQTAGRDSGVHTIVPKKTGKVITASYLITAVPNVATTANGNLLTAECGLVTVGQGTLGLTNATNNSVNGTVTTTAGDGLALQFDDEFAGGLSTRGGTCQITVFIDTISGETVP